MSAPAFISSRLFRRSRGGGLAMQIATAGVAVGVFVMLLSVSIVLGFRGEIRKKMASFSGHIQVMAHESLYSPFSRPVTFSREQLDWIAAQPHVESVRPFALKEGMLKTDEVFRGMQLKGVEADSVLNLDHGPSLRISRSVARALGVKCGDRVFAYFFDGSLRARRFTVVDIYETHLKEFDENVCFCPLPLVQQLNGWTSDEVGGLEVTLDSYDSLDDESIVFKRRFNRHADGGGRPYVSLSVKELYPQIFSWLSLLDGNVWAILILMTLVAATTVVCGLLIIILEETGLIGLLKALGSDNRQVRAVFLRLSALIVVRALLWGNALAFALIALQRWTGLLRLDADTYYLSEVPMYFSPLLFLLVNVAVFVVTIAALLIPSLVISHIRPAQTMRFE